MVSEVKFWAPVVRIYAQRFRFGAEAGWGEEVTGLLHGQCGRTGSLWVVPGEVDAIGGKGNLEQVTGGTQLTHVTALVRLRGHRKATVTPSQTADIPVMLLRPVGPVSPSGQFPE